MMRRSLSILIVSLFACLASTPEARADLADLFRASLRADAKHSYVGVKVIQRYPPGQTTPAFEMTVRVTHRAPDETRIDSISGGPPGGLMLFINDRAYVRRRDGEFDRLPTAQPDVRPDLLLANYRLRWRGPDTIAGRRTFKIAIEPRYPGNPRKVIWLDTATRLTLRTELYDSQNRLAEVSFFQEIDFDAEIPSHLFAIPGMVREPPDRPVTLDFEPIRPRYTPPGYQLAGTRSWSVRGAPVVHLRYTDGLNTLSLFQSRSEHGVRGRRHFREREGRSHVLSGQVGEIYYVLIGDIDRDELQRMADSLRAR